jgi:DNA-binding CsgD family transcriptional regulator
MGPNEIDNPIIHDEDLRAVVRLLGSATGLEGPIEQKRRHLCEGMAQLVDADGWIWTTSQVDAKNAPSSVRHLYGGLSDVQVTALLEEGYDTNNPSPANEPLAALVAEGKHFTRTRQQVVHDEEWYDNDNVRAYRLNERIGIDNCMYSIVPQTPGAFCGVGFFRWAGRDPFDERQRRIAHIVTTEVAWLCDSDLPTRYVDIIPDLPPRLRTVLTLLVDGCTCEEIADILCLSPHTIKGYIKEVYATFDVHSQPKLMRLFRENAPS